MEKSKFNEMVLNKFPEVYDRFKPDKDLLWDDEEPGATILVEDYFMPVLYEAIDSNNKDFINRVQIWLNDILSLNDEFCDNVIYVAFFEKLYYDKKIDSLANGFLPQTKSFYEKSFFN